MTASPSIRARQRDQLGQLREELKGGVDNDGRRLSPSALQELRGDIAMLENLVGEG